MLDLHRPQYAELVRLIDSGAQTFLVVGDDGVGKKTLIRRAVEAACPSGNITEYQKLNIEEARRMKQLSLRRNIARQIHLIDGDNVTAIVYNALLKFLEEPPPEVIIIIAASKPPLPTIVSRCRYIMVPPLTVDELKQVLAYKGMSERASSTVIHQAYGSVAQAFRVYEKFEEKRRLLPFIKALKDRDLDFVLRQARLITREDVALLVDLADDVLLARYGLLNQEFSAMVSVSTDFIMRVKAALLAGNSPALSWLRAWFETA